MASTAEAAAARFAAILASVPGAASVERDRTDAFARDEGSCILVEIASDDAQPHAGQPFVDRADVRIAVVYLTRNVGWQTVLDDMREAGHALVMGDTTLRALLTGLRRDTARWQAATADLPFGHIVQTYVAKYLAPTAQLRRVP